MNFIHGKPSEVADDIVKEHMSNGLTVEQAEKAAIVTLQTMLKCGVYSGMHPTVKKTENFLLRKLGLPLSKFR